MDWKQILADQLTGPLVAVLRIGCACHSANALVPEHPELVMDLHRADQCWGVEKHG